MSENQYISESKQEMPPPTELVSGQVITQEMTPVEKMIPLEASIESKVTEEKLSKSETEIKHEKHPFRKATRTLQTSAKLSQLLKQITKNEVEMYEMRKSIESLARMEKNAARSNLQLMKQLRLQIAQLRNQVTRIQKDFRRKKPSTALKTKIRKIKAPGSKRPLKMKSKKKGSTVFAKPNKRMKSR